MAARASFVAAAIVLALAAPARAWDSPELWYSTAVGGASGLQPGGGGILGTGGGHDHGILCTDCHVDRATENGLQLELTFSPALVAGVYTPGQRYTVTAQLSGALLGAPCVVQNGRNIDNFAAAFEDDAGAAAGSLAADDGQSAPSCALPSPPPAGTTALDGDCAVVFASGGPDRDLWTFSWTAPATGVVHVFWGAVDGNCDMKSMHDAAVTGTQTLAAPPMAVELILRWFALVLRHVS